MAKTKKDAPEPAPGPRGWVSKLIRDSSSWMTSFLVHLVLLTLFALWSLPQLPFTKKAELNVSTVDSEEEELEEPVTFEQETLELETEEMEFEEQPETTLVSNEVSFSPAAELQAAASSVELSNIGSESAPLDFLAEAQGQGGSALTGRGQMARAALVRKGGGNQASESAVASALLWLAKHQYPDGTWSFDHTRGRCQGRCKNPGTLATSFQGGTALALLPFLGAGQTHIAGDYQEVVGRGLAALVSRMKVSRQGGSFMDGGTMYSQGIAATVLCEAYAMTGDPDLERPAQLAIDFICYAQDPIGGGWQYKPQQVGLTSVTGWQIMALKSGYMASLHVPASVVGKAYTFLDAMQVDQGAGYGYDKPVYRPTTSAIGLLCRMYLGWKRENEVLGRGVLRLAKGGPSKTNFYHNYYATQVLFQHTDSEGELWEKWNTKLRDMLVASQIKKGHEEGSWFAENGLTSKSGGRLYNTAIACMTLEIYYRHMPIYRTEAVDVEFPE